jgi:hypothetical protein
MRVLHARCCGLDIHTKCVVACLLATGSDGTVHKEVRPSSTRTAELLTRSAWLRAAGCGPVVMESTGSSWRPVFNLLEGQCAVVVVTASHVTAVPGRKTDVKDAEWLADWLRQMRHGLLRASFLPPAPPRHLRDLTRYRLHLVASRTSGPGSPTGCKPFSRTPPASSPQWSPMCAASGRGRSSRPCSGARPTRGRWPSWHLGSCLPSERCWLRRSLGALRPTTSSRHA